MDEKTVVITEQNGEYRIQNNGISEFALIGILECIIFDMKTARRALPETEQKEPLSRQKELVEEPKETESETKPETRKEIVQDSGAPDLRTRISNAVKAIRGLGGKVEDTDLSKLTDDELQVELEELTGQYKRLKSSKTTK